MDQILVATIAVIGFAIFMLGYWIGDSERQSRDAGEGVHCDELDLERRARRCQQ